jgi:PEP-CTERM motif
MLTVLTDVSGYQSAHSLSNSAFLAMADINRDGVINNADLQALLIELQNSTAANAPVTASTVLTDLTTASDHLPVVADYSITFGGGSVSSVPEPSSLALVAIGSLLVFWRRGNFGWRTVSEIKRKLVISDFVSNCDLDSCSSVEHGNLAKCTTCESIGCNHGLLDLFSAELQNWF